MNHHVLSVAQSGLGLTLTVSSQSAAYSEQLKRRSGLSKLSRSTLSLTTCVSSLLAAASLRDIGAFVYETLGVLMRYVVFLTVRLLVPLYLFILPDIGISIAEKSPSPNNWSRRKSIAVQHFSAFSHLQLPEVEEHLFQTRTNPELVNNFDDLPSPKYCMCSLFRLRRTSLNTTISKNTSKHNHNECLHQSR